MNVAQQSGTQIHSRCTDKGAAAPGGTLCSHARQLLPDRWDPSQAWRTERLRALETDPGCVLVPSFGAG